MYARGWLERLCSFSPTHILSSCLRMVTTVTHKRLHLGRLNNVDPTVATVRQMDRNRSCWTSHHSDHGVLDILGSRCTGQQVLSTVSGIRYIWAHALFTFSMVF